MNKPRRTLTIILPVIGMLLLFVVTVPPARSRVVQAQVAENPPPPRERLPNIVGSWRLNETSGTMARDSWGSNHGTHATGVLVGAPRLTSGSPPGYQEIFYSADYNGSSGRTTVNSSGALNLTNTIALQAWIRPDSLPSSQAASTILRKDSQYLLRVLSNGGLAFRLWIGGSIKEAITPAGTIAVGEIYHVFATYNGSSQVIYVNGVAKSTRAQTGSIGTSANPLLFGASSSGGISDFFDGRIDEVVIYSTAPSSSWVSNHYNSFSDRTPPDTTIMSAPSTNTTDTAATFSFKSPESASTFQCKLDGGAYATCVSPKSYTGLAVGSHMFSVRAVDPVGNIDSSQATYSWTVATYPAPCTRVAPSGSDFSQFINSLVPGDVGCLRSGVFSARGTYAVWYASGTPSARITLRGYPGESRPTILGALYVQGDNLVLSGLLFDGPTGKIQAYEGLREVDQVSLYGDNIEINHCEVRNNAWHAGIYLETAYNARLIANYIHDNGDRSDPSQANLAHGIYFASGSGLIANNVVEHNYAYGVHLYTSPSNVIVQQNTIIGNGRSGVIIGGQTTDCDPVEGCPPQPTNNLVINNIIAFNDQNSVRSWQLTGSGNVIKNNLIWGNPWDDIYNETEGLTFINNIQADPRFVGASNYRLQPGSPAIDAAASSHSQADDYDGTLRPQGVAPDIGAFESMFHNGAANRSPIFGSFALGKWPAGDPYSAPSLLNQPIDASLRLDPNSVRIIATINSWRDLNGRTVPRSLSPQIASSLAMAEKR